MEFEFRAWDVIAKRMLPDMNQAYSGEFFYLAQHTDLIIMPYIGHQ